MIINAKIENITFKQIDNKLYLLMDLDSNGWHMTYGGRDPVGSRSANSFFTYLNITEILMKIMEITDATDYEDIKGKYIRVELESLLGGPVYRLGHILEDKWFED